MTKLTPEQLAEIREQHAIAASRPHLFVGGVYSHRRALLAHVDALQAELIEEREEAQAQRNYLKREKERIVELEAERDALKLQAQAWAQEARTQRATVHAAYQACTGATGEPGDWNGAEPIRRLAAERDALRADESRYRWIEERGMWALNEALERYPDGTIGMAIDAAIAADQGEPK